MPSRVHSSQRVEVSEKSARGAHKLGQSAALRARRRERPKGRPYKKIKHTAKIGCATKEKSTAMIHRAKIARWNRVWLRYERKARGVAGPSGFVESGDGYLPAALVLASSGTTPSCCIRPRASQLTWASANLPFDRRATVTPEMLICFPVGAIPPRSPL
jgi:hypothetical protein